MSAWPVQSCIEYWFDVRLIQCFRCFNIGWHVSLTCAVMHWILSQCSANPMFLVFQYWMVCQPDQWSQALNIESMFSLSDVSGVSILDGMSAWPVKSCNEYWVDVQLIRCFWCFNIVLYVSLSSAIRHWILSQFSANPMFPVFQYWMVRQPDRGGHALNIESVFSESSILYGMSAWPVRSCIEYWVKVQRMRCFRCFNIGWYVIQYWNTRKIALAEHWLNIQSLIAVRLTSITILKHRKRQISQTLTQYSMHDFTGQADMPSNIKTPETSDKLNIDSIFNAWLHWSGWHTHLILKHWTHRISQTLTQYSMHDFTGQADIPTNIETPETSD